MITRSKRKQTPSSATAAAASAAKRARRTNIKQESDSSKDPPTGPPVASVLGPGLEANTLTHGLAVDAVREFLVQCRLGQRLDMLLPHLQGLGVEGLEDLLDVEREDLKGTGLTVIETNRFFRLVGERLKPSPLSACSLSPPVTSTCSTWPSSPLAYPTVHPLQSQLLLQSPVVQPLLPLQSPVIQARQPLLSPVVQPLQSSDFQSLQPLQSQPLQSPVVRPLQPLQSPVVQPLQSRPFCYSPTAGVFQTPMDTTVPLQSTYVPISVASSYLPVTSPPVLLSGAPAPILLDSASVPAAQLYPGSTTGILPSSPLPRTTAVPITVDSSSVETIDDNPATVAGSTAAAQIVVRYILCSELFATTVQEKMVFNLNPETTAMKDLYGLILHQEKVAEGFTLELFSHEGYPLSANEFTSHCTLKQWGMSSSCLFYVFVRREDQSPPDDGTDTQRLWFRMRQEEQPKPPLDHNIGKDELVVESTVFGTFTIKANVDTDSVDNIYQKVSSATKVPTPSLCLSTRRGYERLNVDTELQSGDIMSLVLKNPQDYLGRLGTEYGAKTYYPVVPQTDSGAAKFFSIVKFLCSKERDNVDLPRLLAYLQKLTNCPPMVHALQLLYQNSYLSLPCWVALVEGFYQLFRSFLSTFCIVEDKKVFEFSDYFWGMIIDKAEFLPALELEECEKLCLVCPISQHKIVSPVTIPGCTEVFDRRSVLEKIEAGVSIAGCSQFPLCEADLKPDPFTARMLVYNPWHNEKDIYVWKKAPHLPTSPSCVQKVPLPCDWAELSSKLHLLRVAAPSGLFSGNECITFIKDGQLAYFMGFSKGKDSARKVFNPVKCEYEYHSIEAMAKFAESKEAITNVVHDLTNFLKAEIKSRTPHTVLEKARPEPIVAQKEVETVDWDPEEAIVVLLDASGSMSIEFDGEDEEGFTRLQAAKDFFEAFANRSQAYDFKHSMGLTVFSETVTITQELTRIYQFFRESLEQVDANCQTALNDAMMSAIEQLKDYTKEFPNCRRRILCLTDGYDNCSTKTAQMVAKTLQQEKVVVDTVLITDSPENLAQKAITHASGGACFLPKSQSEALKLFEMETLLSIRARVSPEIMPVVRTARDLKKFERLTTYPYDSGQLPSNFIQAVQGAKTASAEKVLRRASLALSLENPETSTPNACLRRILREIKEFRRNPHPDIEIFPSEESMAVWKILMRGPEGTPYAGGVFLLCVKFPPAYPSKPPEVRFLTPIYHCNINGSGRICHRVFGHSYTPSVTMRDILSCVCGLLMSPEPDDPLDSVLADAYYNDDEEYEEKAQMWTVEHATKKTFEEMKKELAGGEEAAGPSDLKCPLTGNLFEDPVIAPSGHTYERAAILEHLQKQGGKDPITRQPLSVEQLTPNRAMKALVEQYRKGASRVAF